MAKLSGQHRPPFAVYILSAWLVLALIIPTASYVTDIENHQRIDTRCLATVKKVSDNSYGKRQSRYHSYLLEYVYAGQKQTKEVSEDDSFQLRHLAPGDTLSVYFNHVNNYHLYFSRAPYLLDVIARYFQALIVLGLWLVALAFHLRRKRKALISPPAPRP